MQDRYTGDIGDFGKLGLLRRLEESGLALGVNWYLTPDESHNGDGRHTAYLSDHSFSACDGELWRGLGRIVSAGERRVSALESSGLLRAEYYSRVLSLSGVAKAEREARRRDWHRGGAEKLRGCGLVFADPDNGLIVPSAEGTAKSAKFALPEELAEYYRAGASVVYYQHKARRPDEFYETRHRALLASGSFPGAEGLGLKFCPVSQRFYFFIMRPGHGDILRECVFKMLESGWKRCFKRCGGEMEDRK